MSTGESKKAIIAALAANMGIAVAKFFGFVITRSGSMLAEAAHSVADSGNQALLLLGGRRAARRADIDRPFGYERERYFFAFLVAVILFTAGAGFAAREGIHKLAHPHELESPAVAIVILSVAIVLECFSLLTAVHAANIVRAGRGWWTFIRQSKNAELTTVLLEDTAALLGLVLALGGVGLSVLTDDSMWDAIGTLAIAALLAVVAIVLAVETKSLLIGEGASPAEVDAIFKAVGDVEELRDVLLLRTEHRGPEEILVALKVGVAPRMTTGRVAKAINEAEERIRAAVPSARYIFIEPDLRRDEEVEV
ncbi:MAG TPA: cation diffusion facilitator family transporter [Actinomycetota bacterium]|nr:cation diffusion facilitator family transporter [Actinomycetota bacterium]